MGRDSNPERDWGRPSWPVGPGKGGSKKTVRDSKDGKGCAVLALALLAVPVGLLAALGYGAWQVFG